MVLRTPVGICEGAIEIVVIGALEDWGVSECCGVLLAVESGTKVPVLGACCVVVERSPVLLLFGNKPVALETTGSPTCVGCGTVALLIEVKDDASVAFVSAEAANAVPQRMAPVVPHADKIGGGPTSQSASEPAKIARWLAGSTFTNAEGDDRRFDGEVPRRVLRCAAQVVVGGDCAPLPRHASITIFIRTVRSAKRWTSTSGKLGKGMDA